MDIQLRSNAIHGRKFARQISLCGTEPSSDTRNLPNIRIENYRYPKHYAAQKVPQAHLHLLGLLSKIFFLPHKIAKKSICTFMIKALAK